MTDNADERVIAVELMGWTQDGDWWVSLGRSGADDPLIRQFAICRTDEWHPSTDANLWFGDEGLNTAIRSAPAWQGMTDHGGGPVVKTLETGYIVALRSLILKRQGMCGEFDIISASLEDRTCALAEAIREMKGGEDG